LEFKSWHTNVKLVFLNYLYTNLDRIDNNIYELLRDKLNLHNGYNVEVSAIWLEICLALKKSDIIEHVKNFLSCNGRMKYIRPIYFKFLEYDRNTAVEFFKEKKYFIFNFFFIFTYFIFFLILIIRYCYHSICQRIIQAKFDASF
jgi:hypothetical protein